MRVLRNDDASLEKSGESTRGGRRSYYRMPDRAAVQRALDEWDKLTVPLFKGIDAFLAAFRQAQPRGTIRFGTDPMRHRVAVHIDGRMIASVALVSDETRDTLKQRISEIFRN